MLTKYLPIMRRKEQKSYINRYYNGWGDNDFMCNAVRNLNQFAQSSAVSYM